MENYSATKNITEETHYFSAKELSQLMLCKICGLHGGNYEEFRLLEYYAVLLFVRTDVPPKRQLLHEPHSVPFQKTTFFLATAVNTQSIT
jgi:hypothetical protein